MLAEHKASNCGMAANIIGVVLVDGAVAAFGIELVGGIAAAWYAKSPWDASKNTGNNTKFNDAISLLFEFGSIVETGNKEL